jgi:hypothetical protein
MVARSSPEPRVELSSDADATDPPLSPETLEAEQDLAHGIAIPAEEILAWVRSWDTPDELPMPKARALYD